jgi:hypothetical protein
MTTIFEAASEGKLHEIQKLVTRKNVNDKDENGKTLLHYASENGQIDIIKVLINVGAVIDAQDGGGRTSLFLASNADKKETVNVLLNKGADPNIKDSNGDTAMHVAAGNGDLDILKLLIEKGGEINSVNNFNWSVLHNAAYCVANYEENWDMIKWLLEAGADKEAKATNPRGEVSVRDVLEQKDWSYASHYDEIVSTLGAIDHPLD